MREVALCQDYGDELGVGSWELRAGGMGGKCVASGGQIKIHTPPTTVHLQRPLLVRGNSITDIMVIYDSFVKIACDCPLHINSESPSRFT